MIEALAAGAAYFLFVFLKAFQQKNVVGMHYRWIMPISYLMAASEVFIISVIAFKAAGGAPFSELIIFAFTIGTGGGLGATVGMYIHNRHFKKGTP